MSLDNAKNFAKVVVSTGYDASATSVVLNASEGAKLPTAPFNATWYNSTDYPDPSDDPNVEIITITNIATDTLTIVRAQEGTTAKTHNTGGKTYKIIAGLTAKVINIDIPALIPTTAVQVGADYLHGIQASGALSFDNSTHIITIASGTNTYWFKGAKYTTASAITCDLDSYITLTTNTLYFVYFDDATGTLKASTSVWDLKTKVPVATVFWNGSAGAIVKETHSYTRDIDWHLNAHATIGSRASAADFPLTKPSSSFAGVVDIAGGTLYDEDLAHVINQQTNCRVWYQVGASTYTFVDSNSVYPTTAKYVDSASAYALTDLPNAKYINVWIYASPDIARNIYCFVETITTANLYGSLTNARAATPPNLSNFGLSPELKLLYRVIYKGDDSFQEITDYRNASSLPTGGSSAVSAAAVSFVPSSVVSSSNVQGAIDEVASKIVNSNVIGETPSGTINGVNTTFTIAVVPNTGSVEVYLNGQRRKLTTDYTMSSNTLTMVAVPQIGDILTVDYLVSAGAFSTGSASWANNETPAGTVDGANSTFTLANTPVAGSLALYRDGQLMTGGGADYTLTTNSIAFVTAPVSGSVLLAFYQSAASSAGNADLLDGYHALGIMSALNPIGTIREFNISTNPATLLGFGTWAEYGKGRVTVAINATDTEFDLLEETGGEKTHLLTGAESGEKGHNHIQDQHRHHLYGRLGAAGSGGGDFNIQVADTANYDSNYTTATNQAVIASNASSTHNNIQPYIVVYRWVRTA